MNVYQCNKTLHHTEPDAFSFPSMTRSPGSWVTPHFLQAVMLIIIQCSGLLGLNELLNINSFVNTRFCILSKLLQKPLNGLVHATPPLVSAQLVQVSLPWRVGQLPQPAATLYRVYSSSAHVAVISVALLDMWMPKKTFLSNIWETEQSIKDLTRCLRDGSGPSTVCWSLSTTGPSESVAVNKPSSRKRKRWHAKLHKNWYENQEQQSLWRWIHMWSVWTKQRRYWVKHGGGSVRVWDGVGHPVKTDGIVNLDSYCQMLEFHLESIWFATFSAWWWYQASIPG